MLSRKVSHALALVTTSVLSSCSSMMVDSQNHISSNLRADDYNSISARYMKRPTFVSSVNMKNGSQYLNIKVDSYGVERNLSLSYKNRDFYVQSIDKYLSWERKAKSNGDVFNKEIGSVKELAGQASYYVLFTSGNKHSHYLEFGIEVFGKPEIDVATFDRANAVKLRGLLMKMPYSTKSVRDSYQ